MCLQRIYRRNNLKDGIGYKWMRRSHSDPKAFRSPVMGGRQYLLNRWYSAHHRRMNHAPSYPLGFHIFRTEEDARGHWLNSTRTNTQLCKVEYTDTLVSGLDSGARTVVAQRMKIVEVL